MNKAIMTVATDDGRPFRLVRVAVLAAAIFGVFWLAVVLLFPPPDLQRARQQAADLQAVIRKQPELAEVRVDSLTNAKLVVSAPDELPAPAKAVLERIVAQHAPPGTPPVSYMQRLDSVDPNSK